MFRSDESVGRWLASRPDPFTATPLEATFTRKLTVEGTPAS
jgi:hypothetical protein